MAMSETFAAVWSPLQPDEASRKMDARIVAVEGETVVAHYIWRARDGENRTLETPVLAVYRVKSGKLVDSRMFHYDLPGVIAFIENAQRLPPL